MARSQNSSLSSSLPLHRGSESEASARALRAVLWCSVFRMAVDIGYSSFHVRSGATGLRASVLPAPPPPPPQRRAAAAQSTRAPPAAPTSNSPTATQPTRAPPAQRAASTRCTPQALPTNTAPTPAPPAASAATGAPPRELRGGERPASPVYDVPERNAAGAVGGTVGQQRLGEGAADYEPLAPLIAQRTRRLEEVRDHESFRVLTTHSAYTSTKGSDAILGKMVLAQRL